MEVEIGDPGFPQLVEPQPGAESEDRQFTPLDAAALMSLPRFAMTVWLSIDGATSDPFTARTLPPAPETDAHIAASAVRAITLDRYGRPADVVDRALAAAIACPAEPVVPAAGVGWEG